MGYEVSIKQAKDRFSELVRAAEGGATAVITRNGKPVADIVPHVERKGGLDWAAIAEWKRELGIDKIVTHISDDFDEPLPDSFWFPDEQL